MDDQNEFGSGMDGTRAVQILLVEDNPTDAELCLRALHKHNLANSVAWVKDGVEALDFLFQQGVYAGRPNHNPKVVLLDLRLPKVDGLEVLRRLKADAGTRMIPVTVLTSSKEDRDLVESYQLGVNSYIAKPVQFEAFVETVSKLGYYWLAINRVPDAARSSSAGRESQLLARPLEEGSR